MTGLHLLIGLAGERYALPVEGVREVGRVRRLTAVPGAPPAVLGVVNLRGEILTILDAAALLGVGGTRGGGRIVVLEGAGRRAGLAVEALLDVMSLPPELDPVSQPGLLGSALVEQRLVGVVDIPALLTMLEPGAVA